MTTYQEFLNAHRSRANRIGHLIALVAGISVAAMAVWCWGWPCFLLALPIIGVGGGLSHHYFDGNKPAFFERPWEIPVLLVYDVWMALDTAADWILFWVLLGLAAGTATYYAATAIAFAIFGG